MKKIFVLLVTVIITAMPCLAKNTAIVQSLDNFSSVKPKSQISVRSAETVVFKSGFMIERGSVIKGTVVKISDPKRGKRNAYIVINPSSYTIPSKGGQTRVLKNRRLEAKVTAYKKMNKKESVQKGAVSATGLFVPGLPQIYYFGKGYSNPEKGKSRAASGGRLAYKNSPFVYVEKGDEMYIRKGSYMKLKFYDSEKPKWQVWKKL